MTDWYAMGVYQLINKINGMRYIGSSSCFYLRKVSHISMINREEHFNPKLQKDILKYGSSAFEFHIVQSYGRHFGLCPKKKKYITNDEDLANARKLEYDIVKFSGFEKLYNMRLPVL